MNNKRLLLRLASFCSRRLLRRLCRAGVFCTLSGFYGVACADGWYIGSDFLSAYATADGTHVTGLGNGAMRQERDDVVIGFALRGGYGGNIVQAELEYSWRYRFDFNSDVVTATGTERFKRNLGSHVGMFNLAWLLPSHGRLTPYVGAGIGAAHHHSKTRRHHLDTGISTTPAKHASTHLAWAFLTGVEWAYRPGFAFRFGYRFTDLGDINGTEFADGVRQDGGRYYSHDLLVGARYEF